MFLKACSPDICTVLNLNRKSIFATLQIFVLFTLEHITYIRSQILTHLPKFKVTMHE